MAALGLRTPRPQVNYPPRFKAVVATVVMSGFMWVSNYLTHVLPTIETHSDTPCKYNDSQLTYNAKMLFVYFVWLALARSSLFLPCVATRVALVQSRTHGFCRTYCVHLVIRDGPLYIFVVGSMLFWFHLMQSPTCEERSPELYKTLQLYAIYSCLISILCLLVAYWHNKILIDTARQISEQIIMEDRSAPAGTLERLETRTFDPACFGDEEGKEFPGECPICLGTWEPDELIKVTVCRHAFHEECIGNWLRSARTCALCRQDLTKPVRESEVARPEATRSEAGGSPTTSDPPAQIVGSVGLEENV